MPATQAPVQTEKIQAALTPADALDLLLQGNERFRAGRAMPRDLHAQREATAGGQHPFAVVLGCIDSRVPVELVFDQGIGDIFTARVAGNVVGSDVLGSMEFACKVAGARAVVVLGHTGCGAVMGALAGARLGNLGALVAKIGPAVEAVGVDDAGDPPPPEVVDAVAEENVRRMVEAIRTESDILREMEERREVVVRGAMYHVASGAVWLLD